MSYLVIACPMLQMHLNQVLNKNHVDIVVLELPQALHEQPASLQALIQNYLTQADDYEAVLLLLARCGGHLDGLTCPVPIIIPRVEDCIDLLLAPQIKEAGIFYLTPAWLAGPGNFLAQYERLRVRYDSQKALFLLRELMHNYRALCFIELFTGQMQQYQLQLDELSKLLALPIQTCAGSTQMIEDLLTGKWDERFLVMAPGQPVKF